MYTFALDTNTSIKGQTKNSSGGYWFLMSADGNPIYNSASETIDSSAMINVTTLDGIDYLVDG